MAILFESGHWCISKSLKLEKPSPPKLVCIYFTSIPTCMSFLSQILSPKLEKPHPSKLVCMHFTSTLTCMNFLSQFYFLTPMDYSPWSERETWPFLKASEKGQNL